MTKRKALDFACAVTTTSDTVITSTLSSSSESTTGKSRIRTNGRMASTPSASIFKIAEEDHVNYIIPSHQMDILEWLQEEFPESDTAAIIATIGKTTVSSYNDSTAHSSTNDYMTTAPSTATASVESDCLNILSSFDNMDVLQLIVSFVGDYQYRFVAAVNRSFRAAYANEFRNNTITYIDTSTVAHAKICYEELNSDTMSDASFDSWGDSFACDDDDDDDEDDCGCGNGCGCGWRLELNRECILCRSAAKHNNLAALMYLKSEDCAWDARTCAAAAHEGNFDLLAWAIEHHCRWDLRTVRLVATHDCFDVLQWVIEHGTFIEAIFIHVAAASHGNLKMLQWAVTKFGIKRIEYFHWIFNAACAHDHFNIARWLAVILPNHLHVPADMLPNNTSTMREIVNGFFHIVNSALTNGTYHS